ncbi:heat shock protein, HSP20 family [Candidatus Desulfosporosinus infrequens]|uniref:Heat shock protein, HSP20 family n=1 Tax=Candidatus Desulfosporosinus infrequens TaxID=2043169 RepID=A0A2U3LFG4_9FIRM|nr:heat shock protein, HSP20 family [Candidatus Desulfosporosinus infrequens]
MQFSNNSTNQYSGQVGQIRLTPVASNFSGAGTTVTYGLQSTNVNAFNTGSTSSGMWVNPQKWNTQTLANNYSGNSSGQFSQTPNFVYNVSAGQFGQTVSGNCIYSKGMLQPSVDISETSSDVMVAAYLSNAVLNDISLNVTDNSVTISASAWTGNEHLVLNRTIALPTSIRAESVDASFQSGVLEIRLPKADKGVRTRTTITPDTV